MSLNEILIEEWHPKKNGNLTPNEVTPHSNKVVWWLGNCGHEWQATIKDRTRGNKCPYCTNRKLMKGFNDIATTYPEIAEQWHPEKNGNITPQDITAGKKIKVWLICPECEKEYCVYVNNKIYYYTKKGTITCSKCALRKQKENKQSLSFFPEAAEWHPTKNGDLVPEQISGMSGKVVWWLGKCGHEWQSKVSDRTARKTGCPYCAHKKLMKGFNDFATQYPELAAEWHPIKNGELKPENLWVNSAEMVWWLGNCGHEWQSLIRSRVVTYRKKEITACPVCALLHRKARNYIREGYPENLLTRMKEKYNIPQETTEAEFYEAMNRMKCSQAELIKNRYEEQLTITKVAEQQGKTKQAVSQNLLTAEKNLVTCLKQKTPDISSSTNHNV